MSIRVRASWWVIGSLLSATQTLIALSGQAQNVKLVIQSGSYLTVSGNNLVLYNTDVQCDGALNASSNLWVTGSNNTAFSGAGVPLIQVLNLNTSDTLKLQCQVDITGSIQFQNGIIDLNGQLLQLNEPATLQSESEASHVTGITGGNAVATASGVINPNQLNIGELGAVLTSSANLGNVTMSRSHQPATNPYHTTLHGIQRTYLIQPQNNTALNATLRFYYLDAELNGDDASTLSLWKSTDGVSWMQVGADTRNAASKYVEKAGITDFSYWTLTDLINPLPLTLLSFKATCENGYALLNWQTGVESELDHFEVERSADGGVWTDLGRVGAFDNPNGASYQYKDAQPLSGSYYRLKMVDISGNYSYSPVFSGGCQDITMPFTVYPNPAETQAVARLAVREGVPVTLQLLDLKGRVVYTSSTSLTAGENQIILPVTGLAAGTYIVRLNLPATILQTQLIKK